MAPRIPVFLFLACFPVIALTADFSSPDKEVSLHQCYLAARETSEPLKRQREEIFQAQARARAALGGAFPKLSWAWRGTRQEEIGDSFGGLLESTQVESRLALQQPLFNGLKEFSAWSGFQKQEARDQWRLQQAEQDLYAQVANAFFDVRSLEKALANSQTTLALAQDRVADLQSFIRLGKSRDGELFSAESEVAALKAAAVRLRGQIQVARELLSFLVGKDMAAPPLLDDVEAEDASLDRFLARAQNRPDLEAQRQEVLGQTLRVRYEKGSYWPSLDLLGNYYTQRPSFYAPIDWDVSLFFGVPLYQGGTVAAQVREARSQLEQAKQTLSYLERNVQSEVRKAYLAWSSSREELGPLQDAYAAAQKSYEAQKRDYRLGLVTNLDVLTALNFMQATKRAWDNAGVEAQRRYVALRIAAGELP